MDDPRAILTQALSDLDTEEAASAGARATVALDQTQTGRLSRMDALQHQAMAQAQSRRRAAARARIQAALARLDLDAYGYCTECGEDIPPARLLADPATPRCAACTRGV